MTSTFSTRLTGVFRKRVSNCPASIVVGLPFRMTVTSPAPAKVNLPPTLLHAGQPLQGLVGVVDDFVSDDLFQIIVQPPLFHSYYGRSALITTSPMVRSAGCSTMVPTSFPVPFTVRERYKRCCTIRRYCSGWADRVKRPSASDTAALTNMESGVCNTTAAPVTGLDSRSVILPETFGHPVIECPNHSSPIKGRLKSCVLCS